MIKEFDIPGLITESELDCIELSDVDRKYFILLRKLLEYRLDSKVAARAWLVSTGLSWGTSPLDCIRYLGMAKRVYDIVNADYTCSWEVDPRTDYSI